MEAKVDHLSMCVQFNKNTEPSMAEYEKELFE